ncbi:MAG TPA: hypothetical protein VLS89_21210 [Candidatus Nanopelagicales bacterium]|nr:hypothetical protein [Candidatus Nanopelagicales bacterium]
MTQPVTVLYEDSAADGSLKEYGPHLLVRQCVADRLGVESWTLRQLEGMPRRGASKLRNDCRRIPPQVGRDGRVIVAVYDADKIHRDVQLPATACKAQMKEILAAECAWRERLVIVFLEKNLETVLSAIRACSSQLVAEETWQRAVSRKDRNARDIILKEAARPPNRPLRELVLQRVPSLGYLVGKLSAALGEADPAG